MTAVDDYEELPYQRPDYTFVLADVPQPGSWYQWGACRTAPHSLFFPERGESTAPAKAICNNCGVREQCYEYAVTAGADLHGIWGATSGRDRRTIRRDNGNAPAVIEASDVVVTLRRAVAVKRGSLYRLLEQLVQHPNQWALVQHFEHVESASSTASTLRCGHRAAPTGAWEYEARRNPDGGSDLYARYGGSA